MPIYNKFFLNQSNVDPNVIVQTGPLLTVEVSPPTALVQLLASQNRPVPAAVPGWALIDTGATRSCVDNRVVSSLGVNLIGVTQTGTAAGRVRQELYPARFNFPTERFQLEFSSVIGVDLSGQDIGGRQIIALLGRDVLARFILIYNGPGGFFSLAF